MFKKSDKRTIYYLIIEYLPGKIDESTFCNEFHCSYDLELNYNDLTDEEYKAFHELGDVSGRFSEYEEDFKKFPGVFFTRKELRQKVLETKTKLSKYFIEFINDLDKEGRDK